jgi:HAMP domain-containing protein
VSGIGARIALGALAVAACAIAIVAVGVRLAGGTAFERLMVEHGSTVATARDMFDETVGGALTVAVLGAGVASLALAAILARWLARPLQRMRAAASLVSEGDLRARVPTEGPEEMISLASSFN